MDPAKYLSILMTILLLVIGSIQFLKNRNKHANKLIFINCLLLSYLIIKSLLFSSKAIYQIPQLIGTVEPIKYLIIPGYYLLIRAYIYDETSFRKYDFLFLLMSIYQIIDFFPLYLSSNEKKIEHIDFLMNYNNYTHIDSINFIPSFIHIVTSNFVNYTVCLILWVEIIIYYKNSNKTVSFFRDPKNAWIGINTLLLSLFFVFTNIAYINAKSYFEFVSHFQQLLNLFSFAYIISILFATKLDSNKKIVPIHLTPEQVEVANQQNTILESEMDAQADTKPEATKFKLNEELMNAYESKIHQHMTLNMPFLKQGYSMDDLSNELNIPKHHLSFTIKQFEKNFNDFINKYRIEYAIELLKTKDSNLYSLEAIAHKSGFSSMPTFIKAFRKETEEYPSEYRKKNQGIVG